MFPSFRLDKFSAISFITLHTLSSSFLTHARSVGEKISLIFRTAAPKGFHMKWPLKKGSFKGNPLRMELWPRDWFWGVGFWSHSAQFVRRSTRGKFWRVLWVYERVYVQLESIIISTIRPHRFGCFVCLPYSNVPTHKVSSAQRVASLDVRPIYVCCWSTPVRATGCWRAKCRPPVDGFESSPLYRKRLTCAITPQWWSHTLSHTVRLGNAFEFTWNYWCWNFLRYI